MELDISQKIGYLGRIVILGHFFDDNMQVKGSFYMELKNEP
jgi:hypothetical protein